MRKSIQSVENTFRSYNGRSKHAETNKRTHAHTLMGYDRTYVLPVTTIEVLVLKTPKCCAKQFRWLNVMECVVICTYWLWVSMSIAIQIVSNRNQNIHRQFGRMTSGSTQSLRHFVAMVPREFNNSRVSIKFCKHRFHIFSIYRDVDSKRS